MTATSAPSDGKLVTQIMRFLAHWMYRISCM